MNPKSHDAARPRPVASLPLAPDASAAPSRAEPASRRLRPLALSLEVWGWSISYLEAGRRERLTRGELAAEGSR